MNDYNKQTVGERSATLISRELRLDDGETDYLARSIDALLKRELAIVNKEKDELLSFLPLSSNRTRWEARELLGKTSKHIDICDDGFNGWHGCVDFKKACEVTDLLIGEKEALQEEVIKLSNRIKELETIPDDYETSLDIETREAKEFEAEGDMYGWNFHMGKKSGIIAGNIYYRNKIEELAQINKILEERLSNYEMSYIDLSNEFCETKNKYEKELEAWEDSAAQFLRNSEWLRGLLEETGKMLGYKCYTCDDGTIMDESFVSKVPELVSELIDDKCELLDERSEILHIHKRLVENGITQPPEGTKQPTKWMFDYCFGKQIEEHLKVVEELNILKKERNECIDMINSACVTSGFDIGDQDVELWRHVDSWHARAWDYWKNKHEENKHDFKVVREQAHLYYKALQNSGNIIQELTKGKEEAEELLREIRDSEVNPEDEADKFLRDHQPSELSKAIKNVEKYKEALREALGMMSPPFDFLKFQELSVLAYEEASTWKEGNELKAVVTDDINCKYFSSLTKPR